MAPLLANTEALVTSVGSLLLKLVEFRGAIESDSSKEVFESTLDAFTRIKNAVIIKGWTDGEYNTELFKKAKILGRHICLFVREKRQEPMRS